MIGPTVHSWKERGLGYNTERPRAYADSIEAKVGASSRTSEGSQEIEVHQTLNHAIWAGNFFIFAQGDGQEGKKM
eukprot:7624954-Pyramimonas_sp.AAC.1